MRPPDGAGGTLFRGVDRAVFAVAMTDRLRQAGVAVGLGGAERLVQAMAAIGPVTVDDLYWVCRVTLVNRVDDLAVFDREFGLVFDTDVRPTEAAGRSAVDPERAVTDGDRQRSVRRVVDGEPVHGLGLPWAGTAPRVGLDDGTDSDDSDAEIEERLPTSAIPDEATPFDLLDPQRLAELTEQVADRLTDWPTRPSRRRRPATSGGSPDLRRTLAGARRTGGEPIRLARRRSTRRRRPVVALLDVSGSMEVYAAAYLHLLRALTVSGGAEVFAFATGLTRLTPTLRLRSVDQAVERATEEVGDRFGGTRIASSLTQLLRHRVWGSTVRGASVLVVSDGWDTDDPILLARRVTTLSQRANRLIWVNPRVAADGFEPTVAGMAAALPSCDALVAGNTIAAFDEVIELLLAPDRGRAVSAAT